MPDAPDASNVTPETFLKHYQVIRKHKREHEDAGMALARAKKAAKTDGIDLGSLKMMEALSKLDPDEAEMRLRNLRRYVAWAGLPLGAQLNMFAERAPDAAPPEAAARHEAFEAEDDGHRAGRAGKLRDDNPWEPGSEGYAAWDHGWIDGQRVIAGGMRLDPITRDDIVPKRGRGRRANDNGQHAPT